MPVSKHITKKKSAREWRKNRNKRIYNTKKPVKMETSIKKSTAVKTPAKKPHRRM